MFSVYAIKSLIRNYIYVGMTKELVVRLERHNSGKNRTTRAYAPFKLVHVKPFNQRARVREYEKYLKSGVGKEYLKSI